MGNSLCIKTRCDDHDNKQKKIIHAKPSNNKSLGTNCYSYKLEDYTIRESDTKNLETKPISQPTNQDPNELLKETDKKIDILPVLRDQTYEKKKLRRTRVFTCFTKPMRGMYNPRTRFS